MIAFLVTPKFVSLDHDHDRCLADALDAAEALCTARKVRLTPIRRQVLEMVWARHEPVRAYDLLDQLRVARRRAAPPTVYRALRFLMEHGLVHRIESLNAYVGCTHPSSVHAAQFLICTHCRSVAELNDPDLKRILHRRAREVGFRVEQPTIEVKGACPDCDRADAATGESP